MIKSLPDLISLLFPCPNEDEEHSNVYFVITIKSNDHYEYHSPHRGSRAYFNRVAYKLFRPRPSVAAKMFCFSQIPNHGLQKSLGDRKGGV